LPLRAAARRVTPRAGPPRPERVGGDTRQADVDFTREPAGAPDVLAEQLAARAKAFISKTRSVCAWGGGRGKRVSDRIEGTATRRGGSGRANRSRHLARSVDGKIFSNRRFDASVVGRGAGHTSARRYHAGDRVPSLAGVDTVTRGGLATRRVVGARARPPRRSRCRIRLGPKKKKVFSASEGKSRPRRPITCRLLARRSSRAGYFCSTRRDGLDPD
jgi:hypothetical protein